MKTKNLFQIALVAGMMSFAAAANAQTFATGTGATDNILNATQVDYVTVGRAMPYATDTAQSNVNAWKADLAAVGLTATSVTTEVRWSVTDATSSTEAALTEANDKDAIKVQWDTEDAYTLKAATTINVDGLAGCDPAITERMVYVLPEPSIKFTGGNAVLACTTQTHNVQYKIAGIGKKNFKYTVTKKQYGTDKGTDAAVLVEKGTAETTDGFFDSTNKTYAQAAALYNVDGATEFDLTIGGLTAGYVYTVTVTEVSDQISRKCDAGVAINLSGKEIKTSFAVVPSPTSTKINHVKNVE